MKKNKISKIKSQKLGFTLVELMIVLGIFGILIISIMGFFIYTIQGKTKSQGRIEVQEQARFVIDHLSYEIRRANAINSTSTFNVNLASSTSYNLTLNNSSSTINPTTFNVNGGIIYIKQGTGSSTAITSSDVYVSNLTFKNLSTSNTRSKNILINLTLSKRNPIGVDLKTLSYPIETSVELQGK